MRVNRFSCLAPIVALVLATVPAPASAQPWACYAFAPGETASAAALRVTGTAHATYTERFQILDPSMSAFVPKERYARLRPGWLACGSSGGPVHLVSVAAAPRSIAPSRPRAERTIDAIRPDPLWILLVLLLLLPIAAFDLTHRWRQRRAAVFVMTGFGRSVIREFERPLAQPRDTAPALRARLRPKPHRSRIDVCLAPAPGRTYPNLSDHRTNVEYDVERIRRLLAGAPFVFKSMRQRGRWVVLSFRAATDPEPGGIR